MKFSFFVPTKIVCGDNCIRENAQLLKAYGKKPLIVTGRTSARINGSLCDIEDALKTAKLEYALFDSVVSNPTVDCVYEGAKLLKEENCDFVIAIGGGSPMDAAKAIAAVSSLDIKRENIFMGVPSGAVMPIVCVPTTAGTGSEVTQYSILTNDEAKTKTSLAAPSLFPSLALLDHKYMSGLPINVTINTAIDALSHAVEGMLSNKASVVTDALAVKSISDICSCFDDMKSGSISPEQREKLLTASTMAGAVIANTGTTAVHSMGYSLTYFKHIDHGRANGLLLPEFLKFVLKTKPEKVGEIIEACGFDDVDSFKNAVDELLGDRETLTKEELELFPKIAIKAKNIANCVVVPDEKVLRDTYKNSLPVV